MPIFRISIVPFRHKVPIIHVGDDLHGDLTIAFAYDMRFTHGSVRDALAHATRLDDIHGDTAFLQRAYHGSGTPSRQPDIILHAAACIGIPGDEVFLVRIGLHDVSDLV